MRVEVMGKNGNMAANRTPVRAKNASTLNVFLWFTSWKDEQTISVQ